MRQSDVDCRERHVRPEIRREMARLCSISQPTLRAALPLVSSHFLQICLLPAPRDFCRHFLATRVQDEGDPFAA